MQPRLHASVILVFFSRATCVPKILSATETQASPEASPTHPWLDKLEFVVPAKVRSARWEVRSESSASLTARHCTSNNSILAGECPRNCLLRNSYFVTRNSNSPSSRSVSPLFLGGRSAPVAGICGVSSPGLRGARPRTCAGPHRGGRWHFSPRQRFRPWCSHSRRG